MAEQELYSQLERRRARGYGTGPAPSKIAPAGRSLESFMHSSWQAAALPLLLFFAIPVAMLYARTSPEQLLLSLKEAQVLQAIRVSALTTLASLFFIILFGTPLAFLMARSQFRFKRAVDSLIDLPTILPPSVAGLALLITFGRRGLVGTWLEVLGIQIAFTQAAVVMAQVFIAAPFFVRAAALGFAGIDPEIEQAAQLDGASRWQMLRYVILPLSKTALVSGSMMSWARALGEFGATILFAGNFPGRTQTMPTAIYLGFEVNMDLALTLSVILVTVSFLSILLVKSLVTPRPD